MNFIDLIILILVLSILFVIIYFSAIKKEDDICKKCKYKRQGCNCSRKNNS